MTSDRGYPMFRLQTLFFLLAFVAISVSANAEGENGEELLTIEKTEFIAETLRVDDLKSRLTVKLKDGPGMTVFAQGPYEPTSRIKMAVVGNTLHVQQLPREFGAGEIFSLFLSPAPLPVVVIEVPKKTPLDLDGISGVAIIEDIEGPLSLSASAIDATIGRLDEASIVARGSSRLEMAAVKGFLDIRITGSANVIADSSSRLMLNVSGSGDVVAGAIDGPLKASILGSGDVAIATVNGPVSLEIGGSGSVEIDGGQATPLDVVINGSGNVSFSGNAEDPDLTINGSGEILLPSYSGKLTTSGTGSFNVGQGGQE